MTFVIDTSGPRWSAAVVDDQGHGRTLIESTDRPDVSRVYQQIQRPTRIAVATGPGSFTGLRVGVSFGLGLAMGLRIPIVPLPSLQLLSARSLVPATAVLEAGRGRVYYQAPGGQARLGDPSAILADRPLVGNVTAKTESALIASRHRFVPETELRDFAAAASKILETAPEVPYRKLQIEYMQNFSGRQG